MISALSAMLRRRRRGLESYVPVATALAWRDPAPSFDAFGATAFSRAVLVDQRGAAMATQPAITYTSGTPANVTVDSTGLCTAVANGTSVITAAAAGYASITQTATVAQQVASATISPLSAGLPVGATQQFTLAPVDQNGYTVASPPAPTWHAVGYFSGTPQGSISSNGVYTANAGTPDARRIQVYAVYPNGLQTQSADVLINVPALTSISPTSFAQGTSAQSFTLTGTDFGTDATPVLSGLTGVTITDFTVVSPTNLAGHIAVTSNAPVATGTIAVDSAVAGNSGAVSVSVVAPDVLSAVPSPAVFADGMVQQFAVYDSSNPTVDISGRGTWKVADVTVGTVDPPVLASIAPTSVAQNTTSNVVATLSDNCRTGQSLVFSGAGITVNSTAVDTAAKTITANITVASNAPTGMGTVNVTDADHGDSALLQLTVTVPPAPTIKNTATYNSGSTGVTTIPFTVPAPASGNLLLAVLTYGYQGTGSRTATISGPAGWTLLVGTSTPDALHQDVWYKVAGASEPTSYTFTNNSGAGVSSGIYAEIANINGTTPFAGDAIAAGTNTATNTSPSVTPTAVNALVLATLSRDDLANSGTISSVSSGWSVTAQANPATYEGTALAQKTAPTADTTTAMSCTFTTTAGSPSVTALATLVIAPAP